MGLNKSIGQMYPWISHTFNPIKGCSHNCSYCYLNSRGFDMTPRLAEKELKTNLGKDRIIFIGSSSDMFGDWIPHEWIIKVLDHCKKYPDNQYVFQTKDPGRYQNFCRHGYFEPTEKYLLGTTIETDEYPLEYQTFAPPIWERWRGLYELSIRRRKFVSIEPIMDFNLNLLTDMIKTIDPEFVTIGADSKGNKLVEPSWWKVGALIGELKKFTEVKIKSNLDRLQGK